MKRNKFLKHVVLAALLMVGAMSLEAANTKTRVEQVTATVTINEDVDYIVESETPFADGALVNIQNTDHAVLILEQVKPSAALKLLANHVQVNGAKASNGSNCQVKLYNRGCIILPYGNSCKPLTVYSEPDFGGEAVNDFGLEDTGGYMNTLTAAKLDNRISSFRLKRGYMVTFANGKGGRGYSRCYIAANADLEVAQLPGILENSISSYRIFKWYDTGKQALANDTRAEVVNALNVTSCYSFGLGEDRGVDCECVPHHIYEDWPSSSACGGVTYSPHLKTNNEPGNSADDHPQTVDEILANWQNLMRTGMRLCSPSSHDGSLGHLREFLDSIDARGWRCDIVDLHCYWPEWNFYNSIKGWVDSYHRPIWISEWVWGASWNNNGIFGEAKDGNRDNPTQAQLNKNRDVVSNICNALNGYDYIERYFYWNSEANCSKLYYNGKLTPAGEMYAQLNSGVGYNGKYDYAPRVPAQRDPGALSITFDKNTGTATLEWHEYNGEMNIGIYVDRQLPGEGWTELASIEMKEGAADYTWVDEQAVAGYKYRVRIIDANKKERTTKAVMAASDVLEPGDVVLLDGESRYIGGNIIVNGDFDMGFYGWTNGEGAPLGEPLFQVVPVGGIDGSSYLQAYGNGSIRTASSVKTVFDLKPQTDYYASGASCNSSYSATLAFTTDGSSLVSDPLVCALDNSSAVWNTKFNAFNSGDYTQVIVALRSLQSKAQFDKLLLAQLFDTQEAAIADGVKCAKAKGEAMADYISQLGLEIDFSGDLRQRLQAISGTDAQALTDIQQLLADALKAIGYVRQLNQLNSDVQYIQTLVPINSYFPHALTEPMTDGATIASVLSFFEQMYAIIDEYVPLATVSGAVKSPLFTSTTGWETKVGTFTGGDQRTNSSDDYTFWNAWWSGLSASEGTARTMAIRQKIEGLTHGLYAVRCLATTEHFCLSDQHAFITNGTQTANSPALTANYFDLPTVSKDDRWETLTSMPVYVDEDGSVTIGFTGSKEGATDNKWTKVGDTSSTGDKREGWWCATAFELLHAPLYRLADATPGQWNVICLPYAITPSEGLHLYQIAGITSDLKNLCLEEIRSAEGGMPCIYRADQAVVNFYEHGEVVKSEQTAPGNLDGYFSRTGRVKVGEYMLIDGQWVRQETRSNYLPKYSATISTAVGLRVISDWTGPTMPIVGADEELGAEGISLPTHDSTDGDAIYTIGGRSVRDASSQHGPYIRVSGGKATKVISH